MRFSFMSCCCLAVLLCCGSAICSPMSLNSEVKSNFQQLIETNSCPNCNLVGAVFNRINLAGANLAGANLAGAQFYLADLAGADLQYANLQGAALGGADLGDADLRGANLTGAVLEGAYLVGARMDGVVTTQRPHLEEGGPAAGELLYVDKESNSKNVPFTDQAYVADETVAEEKQSEKLVEKKQVEISVEKEVVPKKEKPAASVVTQGHNKAQEANPLPEESKRLVMFSDVVVTKKDENTVDKANATEPVVKEFSQENISAEKQVVDQIVPPEVEKGSVPEKSPVENEEPAAKPEPLVVLDDDVVVAETSGRRENDRSLVGKKELQVAAKLTAPEKNISPKDEANEAVAGSVDPQDSVGEGVVEQTEKVQADTVLQEPLGKNASDSEEPEKSSEGEKVEISDQKQMLMDKLLDDNSCVGCDLSGVDLSGRRLDEADLERANFQGANLSGTDLREANLKGANLQGADLRDADLRKADLYRANLNNANLTGARFEEALIDMIFSSGAIGANFEGALRDE